jgi:soluble lytic murein transglycosylase-like protein
VPATHYMPIAVAVMVGGTILGLAVDEALAPESGQDSAMSCMPEEIQLVRAERAADPVQLELVKYLSRRYLIAGEATQRMVGAAYGAAHEVGLDPLLILAIIAIESRFNPIAESVMGAKGLMQIIPRYHREKLNVLGGEDAVFDPESNILVGARILQEYVYRTGTLEAGLQFYNGAFFDASAQYAQKVMAERERLEAVVRGSRQPALQASAS